MEHNKSTLKVVNNIASILAILLVISGIGYVIFQQVSQSSGGDIMTVERLNGEEPIDLEDFIGHKKTILQFVAVPCECCAFSMPFVKEFMASQDEIEVITIVFFGRESEIETKFNEEYKVDHLWGIDLDRTIANHYGVSVSPTYVFFDEEGNNLRSHPFIIANKDELHKLYEDAYNAFHNIEEE